MTATAIPEKTQGCQTAKPQHIPSYVGSALRLGVISNPLSGNNRRRLCAIRRFLAVHSQIPHCHVCNEEDVRATIERFAQENINMVAVNAGDGTVQAVLNTLFRQYPNATHPLLALLPGGTTNMTALDLGILGPRIRALDHLVRYVRDGQGTIEIVQRPVLRVRRPVSPSPIYGLFLGAAGIYHGIQLFHARLRGMGLKGNPANLFIVARLLAAFASRNFDALGATRATIRLTQHQLPATRYILIMAHTLERLILGLRPHWGSEEGPLRLTAISATPRHFYKSFFHLMCGRHSRHLTPEKGYFSHNADEIQLKLEGGFAIDGETYLAGTDQGDLRIDVGGQAAFVRLGL